MTLAPLIDDLLRPGATSILWNGVRPRVQGAGRLLCSSDNIFWKTLHEVGLTDRLIKPARYRPLLDYGIGLTPLYPPTEGY
jgi:double-stranded uracil-DNA glycosylase